MAEAKIGRPSDFTPEIANEICERLSKGEPLSVICDDEHMPHFSTIYRWEKVHEEFCEASTRARQVGTHFLAYDSLRIADDPTLDPADKRVRIDTRLRLIGKWNARQYGEKLDLNHSGTVQTLSDDALDERLTALMAKASSAPG